MKNNWYALLLLLLACKTKAQGTHYPILIQHDHPVLSKGIFSSPQVFEMQKGRPNSAFILYYFKKEFEFWKML